LPNSDLLQAFLPANGMIRIYREDESEPILFLTKETEYRQLHGEFTSVESRSIITSEGGANVAIITKPIVWEDGNIVTLQVSEHLFGLESTMRTLFYVLVI